MGHKDQNRAFGLPIHFPGDRAFWDWLVKGPGVAAIPVSAFYENPSEARLVRFCFAKQDATLEAAAGWLRML